MFTSLLSHVLCAWFAFLLPSFATFKALSHRPASEADLERWSIYWTVVGAFVAFEYVGEKLISWFPFYWEIKTLFLLFLSLPQTQGSTYIYNTYLQPFFVKNEADLDAGIIAAQRSTLAFVQNKLSVLVNYAVALLNKQSAAAQSQAGTTPGQPGQPATVLSALQPATAPASTNSPAPSLAASSSSFQAGASQNAERRLPQTPVTAPAAQEPQVPESYLK